MFNNLLSNKKKICAVCNYNKFLYLPKKDLKEEKLSFNFYVKYICQDLGINYRKLNKLITRGKCKKCSTVNNFPWFKSHISNKIYNSIYGQHHYGWKNLYNFKRKLITNNHGNLFTLLNKVITIKRYGEYLCPFSGLFFDFYLSENLKNKKKTDLEIKKIFKYLKSRQLANSRNFETEKIFIENDIKKSKIDKFLINDGSSLCWSHQCISNSANCKSFGQKLFNYKLLYLDEIDKNIRFDLFAIFMTLDHTSNPKKILEFSFKNSDVVLLHCHINSNVTIQHKFSITKGFNVYLRKRKIYNVDITKHIKKNINRNKGKDYYENEMYLLCSKSNTKIKKINNFLLNL